LAFAGVEQPTARHRSRRVRGRKVIERGIETGVVQFDKRTAIERVQPGGDPRAQRSSFNSSAF
jgi:hypothetical protein